MAQTVTSLYSTSNAKKQRTPIYRAKFAGIAQEYATHPIKTNYRDEVLADLPSAYWRLGEATGTAAADASGNGLSGTYQNAPTLGVSGALTGDSDTAVTLNGTTHYISVADNDLLDPGDTFTLEAWINLSA